MTDPAGLKLPSSKEALLTLMWDTLGFRPTEEEMDMFWEKLTADVELGDPPCECITKKGTEPYWHQECDCMNQGDLADAAGWCAKANLLGRKSNAEKEVQGGE